MSSTTAEHLGGSLHVEDEVGASEFFGPETSFTTRVAELIVRRQHHQYFHDAFPRYALSIGSAAQRDHTRIVGTEQLDKGIVRYIRIDQETSILRKRQVEHSVEPVVEKRPLND
jgi:hypothetical protein